ncbi:hypothetical protein DM02DRAFT_199382 [Periconia macrospinosa]|uniref:Uncharacterized protein n=1 Tax=Periconia macrospinosa TaxID=97972 RepID=A0A2V1D9H5_9PLEO|nr:hypothetical protein DM02DRAFT_199382 [Periconia macrospinosa]
MSSILHIPQSKPSPELPACPLQITMVSALLCAALRCAASHPPCYTHIHIYTHIQHLCACRLPLATCAVLYYAYAFLPFHPFLLPSILLRPFLLRLLYTRNSLLLFTLTLTLHIYICIYKLKHVVM